MLARLLNTLERYGLVFVVFAFGVAMTVLSPAFLTSQNILNLLFQATIFAVLAIGMTFVILTAGIDVSVAATMALASVLGMGATVKSGLPAEAGFALALAVGILVGCLNGVLVAYVGIPPLIATLATLSAAYGVALAYTDGSNVTPVPGFVSDAGIAEVAGVPVFIPFVFALAIAAHMVLTRTTFGRAIYVLGGNPVAARLAGVRTERVLVGVYAIAGVCAAIAGLMLTARLAAASPQAGRGYELTVIAAVVIGGTSLFGGVGNIPGTMLGVLLITMVTNAIGLLGVPSAYDQLVTGIVIAVAAAADVYRTRLAQRALARKARVAPAGDSALRGSPRSDLATPVD